MKIQDAKQNSNQFEKVCRCRTFWYQFWTTLRIALVIIIYILICWLTLKCGRVQAFFPKEHKSLLQILSVLCSLQYSLKTQTSSLDMGQMSYIQKLRGAHQLYFQYFINTWEEVCVVSWTAHKIHFYDYNLFDWDSRLHYLVIWWNY